MWQFAGCARTLVVGSLGAMAMALAVGAFGQNDTSVFGKAEATNGDANAQITVVPIPNHDHIYMLAGAGENIVVQTGTDGTVVVNAGSAQASSQVLAAINRLTSAPIRYVIDTSDASDVVGGNGTLAQAGRSIYDAGTSPIRFNGEVYAAATILAASEVTLRVGAPVGQTAPFPQSDWPTQSIGADRYFIYMNNEAVVMYHHPARDDGDSVVHFPGSDVIVAGDTIDANRFPVLDLEHGGSVQGEIAALNHILALSDIPMPFAFQAGGTYIVPAHGRLYQQFDVVQYRDMLLEIQDTVADMMSRKMTLRQIEAAQPCLGYQQEYGSDSGPWTTNDFVQAVYQSLLQEQKAKKNKGPGV